MADAIALVGGETLLGREVREVFGESSLGQQLQLIAADEAASGKLTEVGGAAAFLAKLDPVAVEDAAVIVLAGTPESSRKALADHPSGIVVDLTGMTESDAGARIRAPQVEDSEYEPDYVGPQIVAHPAATAIAIVLERLHRAHGIAAANIHIFEPASERGLSGIDELQKQTVSLLSFQPVPQAVFDTQLSHAMLARLGDEAPTPLADIEERIERHLATLIERMDGVPMPSLRLVQAPVFHGYSFSLWIQFEDAPSVVEIEESFSEEGVDVRGGDLQPPSNVSVAGQGGIALGAITPDRNDASAVWIWMAADNLRLAAETAARIVRDAL